MGRTQTHTTRIEMRESRFIWDGLTLQHQTLLRGTTMEPRWALVRVKRARGHDQVASADDVADGILDFEQSLFRVSMTGAFLPYSITGTVKAETMSDGLIVTASASLGSLLAALGVSAIGISVLFRLVGLLMSPIYWMWLGLATIVIIVHTLQTASALRRMTALATSLDSAV